MIKTKGYAAPSAKAPLTAFNFERREPKENDVLIDIKYCGICHSDIHQARDEWSGAIFPMVPGHEISGIVAKVGSKVTKFKVGDKVGVGCMVDSCRQCPRCQNSLEQYCVEGCTLTYNGLERDKKTPTFGGYSDHIVVREEFVLRIPENIPLENAAPLLCARITTYSPLRHWKAGPGKKVAIIGLGGLGHMAVKIAHGLVAEVTVLSHTLNKIKDGMRMGAKHFYATSDPETFTKLQGQFDLIICTVSIAMDWNLYLNLLNLDGTMVVLGVPTNPVPIAAFPLILGRRRLAGSAIGGIKETQEMLDFCSKHNIECEIELIPIQKVNEAYERAIKSDVHYRFVIDIKTL